MRVLKNLSLLPTNICTLLTLYQVDPFLKLVDDCKLQAVAAGSNQSREAYGSKSDDENALNSISTIEMTESQSKESFATMIVKALEKPSHVTIALHPELMLLSLLLSCLMCSHDATFIFLKCRSPQQ